MTYEYESNGACPFCGLRGCGHDRTKYQGPFGIAPKVSAPALPSPPLMVQTPPAGGCSEDPAPISAYDEPVEPPPTVVPITPKVGVERVLQGIEKRSKRKKAEQGNLF